MLNIKSSRTKNNNLLKTMKYDKVIAITIRAGSNLIEINAIEKGLMYKKLP